MPSRISDLRIRQFVDTQRAAPAPKLSDGNVVELLAAVGDGARASFATVKAALTRPGISRSQQFELAQAGLSASEKRDLVQVLDASGLAMDPGAKNFLEALVGRAPLQLTYGPLTITGDQRNGIAGVAKAGDFIEAINLSTAPAGRLHLVDTAIIGTADASGRFLGSLPDVREGDVIRLRTRAADGSTSDWLTIQAKGLEAADTRNAVVNLERLDLAATPGGITVTHNTARPLSEPGATLRFVNARTGERVDVKATEVGSLPPGLTLPGRAGDTFRVSVSDGKNNLTHATVAGTLAVPGGSTGGPGLDLPDPAMHKSELNPDGTPRYRLERFTGPLFLDAPTPGDVRQGAIGNCYFPAALASIAHTNPQAIRDMVKQNADGTYTVRFYEGGVRTRPVEVRVDADLYARSFGGPIYGSSLGGPTTKDGMELWFPIVEKAYAQWKGSYDAIGNGGNSGRVMSEVLGRSQSFQSFGAGLEERLFQRIQQDLGRGVPVAAGTFGTDQASRYTNTGVYANHAYSVLGVEEKNGEKFVKLRNPWGMSEPGNDGKNDGVFSLPMAKFTQLFQSLYVLN